MAQNVKINGVTYSNVPSVEIPFAQGTGSAAFYDTSDATLDNGAKMLSGATAYANGTKYTGTIATKTASDLTASGATVTVPAGYYASQATKSVTSGSATGPSSITGTSATLSTGTNTLTLSKTVSVTPVVSAGYVHGGERLRLPYGVGNHEGCGDDHPRHERPDDRGGDVPDGRADD